MKLKNYLLISLALFCSFNLLTQENVNKNNIEKVFVFNENSVDSILNQLQLINVNGNCSELIDFFNSVENLLGKFSIDEMFKFKKKYFEIGNCFCDENQLSFIFKRYGLYYRKNLQLLKALKYFNLAKEKCGKNNKEYLSIIINQSYTYTLLGDNLKAEEVLKANDKYFQKSNIPRETKLSKDLALASIYKVDEKYKEAIFLYRSIIPKLKDSEIRIMESINLDLASAYYRNQEYFKSREILNLFSKDSTKHYKYKYLIVLSEVLLNEKKYNELKKLFPKLRAEINNYNNFVKANYCNKKSKYFFSINNIDSSLIYADSSIYFIMNNKKKNIASINANTLSYYFNFKTKFYNQKIDLFNKEVLNDLYFFIGKNISRQNDFSTKSYLAFEAKTTNTIFENYLSLAIKINENYDALNLAEQNKSNLLAHKLFHTNSKTIIPDSIILKEEKLKSDHNILEKQKYAILQDTMRIDSILLSRTKEQISRIELDLEQLKITLRQDFPSYYELMYDLSNLDIDQVQQGLQSNKAIIEYFWGNDSLFAFLLTKDTLEVRVISSAQDIKADVIEYNQQLLQQANIDSSAHVLYNTILPFDISNYTSLSIIPDGILNSFPFETLMNKNGQYLVETHDIGYQYSIKIGQMLQNLPTVDHTFDIASYSFTSSENAISQVRDCKLIEHSELLCSEDEVKKIKQVLNEPKALVINHVQDVKRALSESKIVHLATHACADKDDELNNKIFIEDDFINTFDLRDIQSNAELVSLSACETGIGKLIEGEGMMSMSKELLSIGAKSTLVSLWSVDDCSTSNLMERFYSELKEGNTKTNAISQAKRDFLAKAHPSQRHPYYWAGFVLIGNDGAMYSNNYPYLVYTLGLLCLILAFLFVKSKQNSKTLS